MIIRKYQVSRSHVLLVLIALWLIIGVSHASLGDRLPDFRDCVKVRGQHICLGGAEVDNNRYAKRKIAEGAIQLYVCISSILLPKASVTQ